MALHSPCAKLLRLRAFFLSLVYIRCAWALTGSTYQLDAEYSGNNFFDGWDFYTVSGPERCGRVDTKYHRAAILRAVLSRKCRSYHVHLHAHILQILQSVIGPVGWYDQCDGWTASIYWLRFHKPDRLHASGRPAEREDINQKGMDSWPLHRRLQALTCWSLRQLACLYVEPMNAVSCV